jgi:hypothetical protein
MNGFEQPEFQIPLLSSLLKDNEPNLHEIYESLLSQDSVQLILRGTSSRGR